MTPDKKSFYTEQARGFLSSAEDFIRCAELFADHGDRYAGVIPGMCWQGADRLLMAYLTHKGIEMPEGKTSADLWAACVERDSRFTGATQDFQTLLSCRWAGCPGERKVEPAEALGCGNRLESLVAELAPQEQAQGMAMRFQE
jgi:hypothetical protein